MLSTSFNYVYEQRYLRFPTRLDHCLFQDSSNIVVSTDAGFTVILIQDLLTTNIALTCFHYGFLTFVIVLILQIDVRPDGYLVIFLVENSSFLK